MFDPDNPRYVSEWDYYAAERERDILEYHVEEDSDPDIYYSRVHVDLLEADDDCGSDDAHVFKELQQIEQYNWSDETTVNGRTATISVAKLKRNDANSEQGFAASIGYKSSRLDFIFHERSFTEVVGVFVSESPTKFNLIDVDTEDLLRKWAKSDVPRELHSPGEVLGFVKHMLPGLVFMVERPMSASRTSLT